MGISVHVPWSQCAQLETWRGFTVITDYVLNTSLLDLAPKVSYGSIGCLKSGYEGMTRIDNEELNRMPGNSRLEKCAWAARIKQASLFTFIDGVCKYRKVFRKMKAISVSQDCANKDQVFFVSSKFQNVNFAQGNHSVLLGNHAWSCMWLS